MSEQSVHIEVTARLGFRVSATLDAPDHVIRGALANPEFQEAIKVGLSKAIKWEPNADILCLEPMTGEDLYVSDFTYADVERVKAE